MDQPAEVAQHAHCGVGTMADSEQEGQDHGSSDLTCSKLPEGVCSCKLNFTSHTHNITQTKQGTPNSLVLYNVPFISFSPVITTFHTDRTWQNKYFFFKKFLKAAGRTEKTCYRPPI